MAPKKYVLPERLSTSSKIIFAKKPQLLAITNFLKRPQRNECNAYA
jgi:hypothetical protein